MLKPIIQLDSLRKQKKILFPLDASPFWITRLMCRRWVTGSEPHVFHQHTNLRHRKNNRNNETRLCRGKVPFQPIGSLSLSEMDRSHKQTFPRIVLLATLEWTGLQLKYDCSMKWQRQPSKNKRHIVQKVSSWWFQPIWKILVKMGIFPK